MRIRYFAVLATGMAFASGAMAEDGEALARKNNCTSCHAIATKVVGPAFRDVAARYRDDRNAQAMLERKVRSGGSGSWGSMPMPATANSVSDGDIRSIVKWVLSLR